MSGVAPVRFNGKDLVKPGYYGKRNISSLSVGAASGSRLLMIGECTGGIPYDATTDYPNADDRVNWVSDTEQLKNVIRSGNAYTGALFALTPSNEPEVNGAPAVGVIRVNKAIKSTLVVKDIDTDDVLDLSSVGYGLKENQITVTIATGTNKGKKITSKLGETEIISDDTTYEMFSLIYSGAATVNTLTLDPAGNLVCTTSSANVPADDVTLDLTSFTDIDSIVAYFNAHASGNYAAVLLGDGTFASAQLDEIVVGDAIDITTTAKTIAASLQAALDHFNNNNELINAALTSGGERRALINLTETYFANGTEGAAVTQTEWQAAIDMAKLIDASFVLVGTSDPAVAASLSAHCTYMSGISGQNERQGGSGSGTADTKSTKVAAAAVINNSLVDYCEQEVYRYDDNGIKTLYAGWAAECMIKGMQAGNAITFAPTNKSMNILGVKSKLSDTDIDDYIKAGCQTIQPLEQGGIGCVRSVTTYQGSNIIANESSAMRTILFVSKDHRVFLQGLVGIAGDATALETIKNQAELRLETYQEEGYFVNDPAFGNAYRSFTFTAVADTVKVSYEATIVIPVNFILVTHNFTVIGAKTTT